MNIHFKNLKSIPLLFCIRLNLERRTSVRDYEFEPYIWERAQRITNYEQLLSIVDY